MKDIQKELSGEELALEADREAKRRKRRKLVRIIIAWLFAIFLLAVLAAGALAVFMAVGGNSLRQKTESTRPAITGDETGTTEAGNTTEAAMEENAAVWQEGWVRYNGKAYEYKEDIMTFLVLGIDKFGEVTENPDAVSGGQSDAIFLVVTDPADKSVSVIAVNRDTMTDVEMIEENGVSSTIQAQIAVQHGFGDGMEESCELTRQAVSRLFYELPIHGYVSINMEAIPEVNDAVGGVAVTVPEDMTKLKPKWEKGAQITLWGKDAFWYVKWRDTTVFESNRGRLARQKQYLTGFIQKAIEAAKADITLPLTLYGELSKYMVTDITADEVAYLAGRLIGYHFDGNAIYTLEGETRMGKKHEEFYYDKEALKDLVIRIFYREVETQ